jgi:transcriptional regulator with XRE-family HTH domain
MEVIRGGDTPKTVLEQRVYNFKHIVDWSKTNLPRYNPHQFELARNLDGLARYQFAKKAKLSTKRYTEIENGDVSPTEREVDNITAAQSHVLRAFFEQWPETEIDCSGFFGKVAAIDYYKYKVFRNINPRMQVV